MLKFSRRKLMATVLCSPVLRSVYSSAGQPAAFASLAASLMLACGGRHPRPAISNGGYYLQLSITLQSRVQHCRIVGDNSFLPLAGKLGWRYK